MMLMIPHHLHEPYAIRCMEAGLHVFLEKPLSHTVRSCVHVIEAAKRAKGVFMVGENSPHWPEVANATQLLKEGVIGETYFAQANYWESIGRLVALFIEIECCMCAYEYICVCVCVCVCLVYKITLCTEMCRIIALNLVSFSDMFNLEDASRRHVTHWRYDPAQAGGGVLMDGATHWVRPLRTW